MFTPVCLFISQAPLIGYDGIHSALVHTKLPHHDVGQKAVTVSPSRGGDSSGQLAPPVRMTNIYPYIDCVLGDFYWFIFFNHFLCPFIIRCVPTSIAKNLPKNDPQVGPGQGGRVRTGVDLQESATQGRSGQCCSGGN